MSAEQINDSWNKLLTGVRRFQQDVHGKNRSLYQEVASRPQRPHTLFITCADSRVSPEALTQAGPGEIFVTRNIGNIVPAYGQMLGAVSAVIEYAVVSLEVSQIVICGHSDCGAMKGLMNRQSVLKMPTVNAWLQNADAALSVIEARAEVSLSDGEKLLRLCEENVLLQLNHLRTHPSVAGRMAQGKLAIYGWVYDIAHGDVYVQEGSANNFAKIA